MPLTPEAVPANQMGSYVGEYEPKRDDMRDACPMCGGLKMKAAKTCIACLGVKNRVDSKKYSESTMERHRRFDAAVQAGWSVILLWATLCALPTWCEICARDPLVVLRYRPDVVIKYRPDVIIQAWWRKSRE